MAQAYQLHEEKVRYLKARGMEVVIMWSCDWTVHKTEDVRIAELFSKANLTTRLNIREAFKGGRTNAFCLQYNVERDEKIYHIDVTSLYPTVNKRDTYPIGHPEIILSRFADVKKYFGIVKCVVKAPDSVLFPLLPSTFNGIGF